MTQNDHSQAAAFLVFVVFACATRAIASFLPIPKFTGFRWNSFAINSRQSLNKCCGDAV